MEVKPAVSQNMASRGGVAAVTLDGELEKKLLLHDDGGALPPVRRHERAAPQKHQRDDRRPEDGGADVDDYRERFVRAYDRLRDELVSDDACELTDDAKRWLAQVRHSCDLGILRPALTWSAEYVRAEGRTTCQMIDYNVPGGKLNRGLSVIDSYLLLKEGREVTEEEFFLACVLGWCVEWIALQTSLGQMLDLISTHNGADNLAKYNIEGYRRIVKYKTSYYSFYLPVACALLLSGAKLENFSGLRDILVEMGIYFQAQDDYLDCFADPNTIGKIGTDIEDHKCSWLVVQALGHADRNQIEVLHNYYGKKDSSSVSKVKNTYTALDLKFVSVLDRAGDVSDPLLRPEIVPPEMSPANFALALPMLFVGATEQSNIEQRIVATGLAPSYQQLQSISPLAFNYRLACGGYVRAEHGRCVAVTLDRELEEKLLLHDDGAPPPARCHERAELQQHQRDRRSDEGDYRERFVRVYDRLRDELVSDEAKRWLAQVRHSCDLSLYAHETCGWGINDGILLKCHIARMIKKYFKEKSYYIDLAELWNEALGHADSNQIEVLHNYYGMKDQASVSKVKNIFASLDLKIYTVEFKLGNISVNKDIFSEFEDRAFKYLVASIEAQQDRAVQEILKSFLKKIHRRKK
ncbi:hypothetical protein PR202_ga18747 [Eleusine coracana subsp. coracana]|uniref:Farnesyl pyrophosphate synthase n=1 Tax=Eleusine coracana subsp. coracana TaxID=191504 RepID=A0AAV5CU08_ELECO|nr:hypothetical protein PR202_ga18747 [Eleusine coracana subsp. coracana]